jgi:hypothetical protein
MRRHFLNKLRVPPTSLFIGKRMNNERVSLLLQVKLLMKIYFNIYASKKNTSDTNVHFQIQHVYEYAHCTLHSTAVNKISAIPHCSLSNSSSIASFHIDSSLNASSFIASSLKDSSLTVMPPVLKSIFKKCISLS